MGGIPGDDDDSAARHSAKLFYPCSPIRPVVQGEDGHGRVERRVSKRQGHGRCLNRRRRIARSLAKHHDGGFDGDDLSIGRFIGTCARADIHDRAGIA
jgi:hypothetical protein